MGSGFSIAQVGRNWRKTFRSRLSGISGVPSGMLPPCWESSQKTKVHFLLEFWKFFSCIKKRKKKERKEKVSVLFSLLFTKLGNWANQFSFWETHPLWSSTPTQSMRHTGQELFTRSGASTETCTQHLLFGESWRCQIWVSDSNLRARSRKTCA